MRPGGMDAEEQIQRASALVRDSKTIAVRIIRTSPLATFVIFPGIILHMPQNYVSSSVIMRLLDNILLGGNR